MSSKGNANRVMHDKDVRGGTTMRGWDEKLSTSLGGYKHVQAGGQPSVYGRYVEPVLHAAEHARRGMVYGSGKEYARAKDELRSVGTGLHQADRKYQSKP